VPPNVPDLQDHRLPAPVPRSCGLRGCSFNTGTSLGTAGGREQFFSGQRNKGGVVRVYGRGASRRADPDGVRIATFSFVLFSVSAGGCLSARPSAGNVPLGQVAGWDFFCAPVRWFWGAPNGKPPGSVREARGALGALRHPPIVPVGIPVAVVLGSHNEVGPITLRTALLECELGEPGAGRSTQRNEPRTYAVRGSIAPIALRLLQRSYRRRRIELIIASRGRRRIIRR
jgi:hypothetical protein